MPLKPSSNGRFLRFRHQDFHSYNSIRMPFLEIEALNITLNPSALIDGGMPPSSQCISNPRTTERSTLVAGKEVLI